MTIVACLEAIALVALTWVLLRHFREQTAQWAVERRELLNRIQRPDHIPVAAHPDFVMPELEPDDIGLVGTITYEEE